MIPHPPSPPAAERPFPSPDTPKTRAKWNALGRDIVKGSVPIKEPTDVPGVAISFYTYEQTIPRTGS